ncbi:MAG: tetratricopeptide repeat protein [Arcobacteraceae bacterium]|nr:tetratricopeptide repeat protein [Arcobacteraceae bacterium]
MIKALLLCSLLAVGLFGNEFLNNAKEAQKDDKHKEAMALFYKAAKYDASPEAIYQLGKYFYEGRFIKQNYSKAKDFFEQASKAGYLDARYALGIFYFNTKNPYHNYSTAYNIFLELSNEGHAPSQNRLGMYLAFGLGADKDYKEAVKWFEKSAEAGYVTGQCHLALMYASGKGVFPNLGRARVLAEEGYNAKNPVCVQVWETFKLFNYSQDKGFRSITK